MRALRLPNYDDDDDDNDDNDDINNDDDALKFGWSSWALFSSILRNSS